MRFGRIFAAALALAIAGLAAGSGGQETAAPTTGGVADSGPGGAAATAAKAASDLRAAIEALKSATNGKDRIRALTATTRAYETGLSALRDALRAASVREAAITARFEGRREEIGEILAVMVTMERTPPPLLMLHPSGPVGMARAGMVLSSVTPALQAEAEDLKQQLAEIRSIRALQSDTSEMLRKGLVAVQDARTALAQAMQEREDLPTRYTDDPEELKTLADNAETLDAFAVGIGQMENDIGAPLEDFAGAKGTLPMPVFGVLLRRAGEPDAAGIVRPGIVMATRPLALVTTPWAATIRYRGPLLDYGNVMILEPASGYLLILAGMDVVFGETGDVLSAGMPVGMMGGNGTPTEAEGITEQQPAGAERSKTLYIELRHDGETIDPDPWFAETKEP